MKSGKQMNTFLFFEDFFNPFFERFFFTDSSASILFHLNVEETSKYFKAAPANIITCEFSPSDLFFFKVVYAALFANNTDLLNVKKNLMPDTCHRH